MVTPPVQVLSLSRTSLAWTYIFIAAGVKSWNYCRNSFATWTAAVEVERSSARGLGSNCWPHNDVHSLHENPKRAHALTLPVLF